MHSVVLRIYYDRLATYLFQFILQRNGIRSGTTPATVRGTASPTPVAKAIPEPELPPTSVETKSS